jgi:hypothetical protein
LAWHAVLLLLQQAPQLLSHVYEVGWYPDGQPIPQVLNVLPELASQ